MPERRLRSGSPQKTIATEIVTRNLQRLFTLTGRERWNAERTQIDEREPTTSQHLLSSIFSHALVNVGSAKDKWLRSQINVGRSLITRIPRVTMRKWRKNSAGPGESIPSIRVVKQRSSFEFPFALAKRLDLAPFRQTIPGPGSFDRSLVFTRSEFATLMRRSTSLAERSRFETRLFENKLRTQLVTRPTAAATDRHRRPASELVLVHKGGDARARSMQFAFAEPARQESPVERVVKKVEEREVVELVKKELKQSLAGSSPLSNFSRQDYEEISDQVYSTLVRRLTVERERLGFY
jgi:hypothetical protein